MPVNNVLWIPHNHGEELNVKALSRFSFFMSVEGDQIQIVKQTTQWF